MWIFEASEGLCTSLHHIVFRPTFRKQVELEEMGNGHFAVLFYNNQDIAKNKPGMQETVRDFCQSKSECLRSFLLTLMDTVKKYFKPVSPKHLCCSICKLVCHCCVCTME